MPESQPPIDREVSVGVGRDDAFKEAITALEADRYNYLELEAYVADKEKSFTEDESFTSLSKLFSDSAEKATKIGQPDLAAKYADKSAQLAHSVAADDAIHTTEKAFLYVESARAALAVKRQETVAAELAHAIEEVKKTDSSNQKWYLQTSLKSYRDVATIAAKADMSNVAEQAYQLAVQTYDDVKDISIADRLTSEGNLAVTARMAGSQAEARHYNEAKEAAEEREEALLKALAFAFLAETAHALDKPEEAINNLHNAFELAQEAKYDIDPNEIFGFGLYDVRNALLRITEVALEQGQFNFAKQAYLAACEDQPELKNLREEIAKFDTASGLKDKLTAAFGNPQLKPDFQADELQSRRARELVDKPESHSLNVTAFLPEAVEASKALVLAAEVKSFPQAEALAKNLDARDDMSAEAKSKVFANLVQAWRKLGMNDAFERDYAENVFADEAQKRPRDVTVAPVRRRSIGHLIEQGVQADEVLSLLELGESFIDLMDHPWQLSLAKNPEMLRSYPFEGGKNQQQEWLANHSQATLAGFNKVTMGRFIMQRLDMQLENESDLHDATEWLYQLEIGGNTHSYDISSLKQAGGIGTNLEVGEYKRALIDSSAEEALLTSAYRTPPDQRFRLPGHADPGSTDKYGDLFWNPVNRLAYQVILQRSDGQSTTELTSIASSLANEYAHANELELTEKSLMIPSWELSSFLQSSADPREKARLFAKAVVDRVNLSVNRTEVVDALMPIGPAAQYVGKLRQLSKNRKAYADDVATWLGRHADTPKAVLAKAWQNRPEALADGCKDSATVINGWAQFRALKRYCEREADEHGVITTEHGQVSLDDLNGRYSGLVGELTRCYGAETSLEAVARFAGERSSEANFGAARIELPDASRFEIIAKDDPRAFTVGYDTGCCMTLGGESESCIWAAVADRRYGIAALYGPDGKLSAQSLLYHNPDDKADTLVIDNIETNEGRDQRKIMEAYRQALIAYLGPDGAAVGRWTRVTVGEGYSDVNLRHLPVETRPSPTPLAGDGDDYIYTDADNQRILLELD